MIIPLTTLFPLFQNNPRISHPPELFPSGQSTMYIFSHPFFSQLSPAFGDCIAPMIMSQNERQSPTTAGTNASPMNSVIFRESSLSAHLKASPRVYLSVKSGEKIA